MINLFVISIFILILLLGVYLYYQNNIQLENFQENCPEITFNSDIYYVGNNSTSNWSDSKTYNSFQLTDFSDDYKKMFCQFNAMRDTLEDLSSKFNYQHYDVSHIFTIKFANDFNSNNSNYFEILINSFRDTPLFKLSFFKEKKQLNNTISNLLMLKIDPTVDPTSTDQMIELKEGLSPTINIIVSTIKKSNVYTNRLIINLVYATSQKKYCYSLPSIFQNHFYKNLKNIAIVSATNTPFTLSSSLNKTVYTEYTPARINAQKTRNVVKLATHWWHGGAYIHNGIIRRGVLDGYSPLCDFAVDKSYWDNIAWSNDWALMVKPDGKYAIPAERLAFVWSNQGGRGSAGSGKVMFYKVENESKKVQEIDPDTNQLVTKTYNYKALGDFSIMIPTGSRPNILGVAYNTGDDANYDPWQKTLAINGQIDANKNVSLSNLPVLIREDCLQKYEIGQTMTWRDKGSKAWRDGASWTTTNYDNPMKDEPGFPGYQCANYKWDWGGPPPYINDRKYIIKSDALIKSKKADMDIQSFEKAITDLTTNNLKTMKTEIDNSENVGASLITQAQNKISSDMIKITNDIGLSRNLYNINVKTNESIAKERDTVQQYYNFLSGTEGVSGFNIKLTDMEAQINNLKNDKANKLNKTQMDALSNKTMSINNGVKPQEYIDQLKNFDDQLNIYKSMSVFQTSLPERKQFSFIIP
jgi:hypothetical protein